MKLNKILMVLAATAIVGCTSEDLNDFSAKQAPEDSRLIELNENFVISGVGVDDAMTRTHWTMEDGALVNKFLPIYATASDGTNTLDNFVDLEGSTIYPAEFVGLCWLGNGAVGTDVYTNYQFYHFGWLNNGETEADVDKCGTLYNGALYSDITPKSGSTVGAEVNVDPTTGDFLPVATALPAKSIKDGKDNLNYNSGVYKTDNKAIFGGDYIVYYPFNEDFDEAGTIPAKAETVFGDGGATTSVPTDFTSPVIGENTFRYSGKVTINGGDQAAGFGMKNLSTLVQLRVATPSGVDLSAKKIDQIVLYSKTKKLLKQANLAADKIVAGEKGEALYASKEETQTIVANFVTGGVALMATDANPTSAYITVLPTTVPDLVVLVHNYTDGTWAQVALGNTVFEAGKAKRLDVTVTAADFKTEYFAVDQTSLFAAIKAADGTHPTEANPATVTLIGDIELTGASLSINETTYPNGLKYINIEDGAIVIPEGVDLTLQGANVKSDIRVLGKGCCTPAALGGRLIIDNGTVVNNVTMEQTEARINPTAAPADPDSYESLNPKVTFAAAGATVVAADALFDVQAGTVEVNGAVEHKGDIQIAKGATLTVEATGDLNFRGTTDDTIDNYGTIEVKKGGKFDITAASGPTTAAVGQRMTNEEGAKFIHNVDAGVGTSVQNMHQNGEYRCRVNKQEKLNDAFLQWTACSVIEMVEAGTTYNLGTAAGILEKADGTKAYKHKGKYINIEVNTTSETTFTNEKDNNVIEIGDLTVIKGGLNVDYKKVDGTTTYRRTLKVHGDMTVKAATKLSNSKQIIITDADANGENKGNLIVDNVELTYKGSNVNVDGLAVAKNINVSGAAGYFNASEKNAIKITCAGDFSLTDKAKAEFGLREGGTTKTMAVTGTISNPKDCKFWMTAVGGGSDLLAWITCSALIDGGEFTGARPIVE